MSEPTFLFFLGIDLGSVCHQVHLLDHNGQSLGEYTLEHGGAAIPQFLDWLTRSTGGAAPQTIAVALEAPRGAVVDALLELGCAVFSINPKQLDRFRDRFSVAGAKDDCRDARVLAHSLRTDRPHFRPVAADHPRIVRLRELSRAEAACREDLGRLANQLWSFLQRYFPALLKVSSAADEPWVWELLRRSGALPARAATLRLPSLKTLLRQHRIRRLTAEDLHQQLRHPLPLASGVAEALAEQVLLLLPRLELLHRQRAQLASRIEELIEQLTQDESFSEHRSVAILRSVPGVGRVCTATVLAEAYRPLLDGDYHALRALAGVAPVTQQSGKTRLVSMRRACHGRLRHALFHAANVHRQKDPRARQMYAQLRKRGHNHPRALRGVADRLLELICVLLRNQTPYDASRRALPHAVAA